MSLDRLIARMKPAEKDGDLVLCREYGLAYQADRTHLVHYDASYFDKCAGYDGQEIANAINAGRAAMVERHVGNVPIVDVGIGSGEFIRTRGRGKTFGHDVNPVAIEWLKRGDLWAQRLDAFRGVTMWDTLEHVPDPGHYLDQVAFGSVLFLSIPIFYGLGGIRFSKHYRPGEHLYYFTEDGLVDWLRRHGFAVLETSTFEIEAGRESIYSFAFRRINDPPP
jgi:hypothetical protein